MEDRIADLQEEVVAAQKKVDDIVAEQTSTFQKQKQVLEWKHKQEVTELQGRIVQLRQEAKDMKTIYEKGAEDLKRYYEQKINDLSNKAKAARDLTSRVSSGINFKQLTLNNEDFVENKFGAIGYLMGTTGVFIGLIPYVSFFYCTTALVASVIGCTRKPKLKAILGAILSVLGLIFGISSTAAVQ